MIPKILHYTWFSGDPFPESIKKCIETWKCYLSDYEWHLWDMSAIESIDSEYLKEALSARKWACASDYVRLYALAKYGGVYLDTDVMMLRNLDDFLNDKVFIGKETSIHFTGSHSAQYLTSHCMGAEKNHPYILKCLSYYEDRHFIVSNNQNIPISLRYNLVLLPYIQAEIARQVGYNWKPLTQEVQYLEDGLVVYPSEYFDAVKSATPAVCQHLALGSWREERPQQDYTYTFEYKIKWRFIYIFQWILDKFDYTTRKLE